MLIFPHKSSRRSELCAKSFKKFLINSGPAFIKFGQFISTRPNILSKEFYSELKELQRDLNIVEPKEILRLLSKKHIEELSIEEKPVATGSIAQVHKARLQDGSYVALKVLRPRIKERFEENMLLLEALIRMVNFFSSRIKRVNFLDAVKVIRESAIVELNMSLEGASMDRMNEIYSREGYNIKIPRVIWALSNKDVLAMEWVEGVFIDDASLSKSQKTRIALRLARVFFSQFHEEGVFHADLHSGNIKISPEGELYLLDFGIVGALPTSDKTAIANIMLSFINRDYERVADIHFASGYVSQKKSKYLFALTCRSVARPIMNKNVGEISMVELLSELFTVMSDFDMKVQPQLLLLQKTIISLESVICCLDPELNMWDIAKMWFSKWEEKKNTTAFKVGLVKKEIKKLFYKYIYSNIDI